MDVDSSVTSLCPKLVEVHSHLQVLVYVMMMKLIVSEVDSQLLHFLDRCSNCWLGSFVHHREDRAVQATSVLVQRSWALETVADLVACWYLESKVPYPMACRGHQVWSNHPGSRRAIASCHSSFSDSPVLALPVKVLE